MENISISGETDLIAQNLELRRLLEKFIYELKHYSEAQFGDSARTSAIYQIALEIQNDYEAISGTTL